MITGHPQMKPLGRSPRCRKDSSPTFTSVPRPPKTARARQIILNLPGPSLKISAQNRVVRESKEQRGLDGQLGWGIRATLAGPLSGADDDREGFRMTASEPSLAHRNNPSLLIRRP